MKKGIINLGKVKEGKRKTSKTLKTKITNTKINTTINTTINTKRKR
jgi:preprotein translocase subunit SecF